MNVEMNLFKVNNRDSRTTSVKFSPCFLQYQSTLILAKVLTCHTSHESFIIIGGVFTTLPNIYVFFVQKECLILGVQQGLLQTQIQDSLQLSYNKFYVQHSSQQFLHYIHYVQYVLHNVLPTFFTTQKTLLPSQSKYSNNKWSLLRHSGVFIVNFDQISQIVLDLHCRI